MLFRVPPHEGFLLPLDSKKASARMRNTPRGRRCPQSISCLLYSIVRPTASLFCKKIFLSCSQSLFIPTTPLCWNRAQPAEWFPPNRKRGYNNVHIPLSISEGNTFADPLIFPDKASIGRRTIQCRTAAASPPPKWRPGSVLPPAIPRL